MGEVMAYLVPPVGLVGFYLLVAWFERWSERMEWRTLAREWAKTVAAVEARAKNWAFQAELWAQRVRALERKVEGERTKLLGAPRPKPSLLGWPIGEKSTFCV